MKVETLQVFSDNYSYLVICENTGKVAAVDPTDPNPIIQKIESMGLELEAIWNTHHHYDHTGGNQGMLEYKKVPVVGHESEQSKIPGCSQAVEDGSLLQVGDLRGRVIHTPGHTMGAITYLVEEAAFTGDTLFGAGCGRLFEGDAATMYRSLTDQLGQLADNTRIFFGHEYTQTNLAFAQTVEPNNVEMIHRTARTIQFRAQGLPSVPSSWHEELATNPFLRSESKEIRQNMEAKFSGEDFEDPVAVFSKVRQLRNNF